MTGFNILLLPGDGIGPEVMAEVVKVIDWFNDHLGHRFNYSRELVGGAAYDDSGEPLTDATMEMAISSDVVLFGAVGGDKWQDVAYDLRPEAALLRLRSQLGLFANLRPAICYPALAASSSLQSELVSGLDILIVRELTGGVYFRQPKEMVRLEDNTYRAVDTQIYHDWEIDRIARVAFELARKRRSRVHSAEKSNVMKTGFLWRQVVTSVHNSDYQDVRLDHILADNCAMQLVRQPKQFDVIVTDNLFGDILSDVSAMLTGSLGMLPSASLSLIATQENPESGGDVEEGGHGLYEPVHGSAPDIAGANKANPIAMIASFAMALRYSCNEPELAVMLEQAIATALDSGARTADIWSEKYRQIGTDAMGDIIVENLNRQANS